MMDSPYIGHWDLEKDFTGTIEKVEKGELESAQGKQNKPLVSFQEAKKPFVANATNCKTIASICGSNNTKDWIGKRITLYATETSAFGEMVECIRVRPRAPK
jgi:hypothetical protein